MENRSNYDRIKLGVLTPSKKAEKFQIRSLLSRLEAFGEFKTQILVSEEFETIKIDEWPVFDILIPYHLDKHFFKLAREYVTLRKPFVFNDIVMQEKILSRKFIYETLKRNGVPVLPFLCVDHFEPFLNFVEKEEYIEVKGKRITKPFVEKPITARNHNVYIYYSKEMGGGCRKLFRKRGNNSSQYYPGLTKVRRDGVYIYEKFINSLKDIKVYSVLSDYSYAEKRKSPSVDGIVDRNIEGFEIRQICPLTIKEANIARKIISLFKQNMCGFDILREDERNSFVIDVNGMSFVKYNVRFYDDVAHILRNHFVKKMREIRHPFYAMRNLSRKNLKLDEKVDRIKGDLLLGVVTIFRHGDRTPKQKEKLKTDCQDVLDLFKDTEETELVFTDSKGFTKLSPIFDRMAKKNETEYENMSRKLQTMQKVMNKDFPCTKLQLKAQKNSNGIVKNVMIICKWGGILTENGKRQCQRYAKNFKTIYKGLGDIENLSKNSRIYASDEIRVQDSARIFTQTLIGEKRPKIRSNEEIEIFLNHAFKADKLRTKAKRKISDVLNGFKGSASLIEEIEKSAPIMEKNRPWILRSFKRIVRPRNKMVELHSSIKRVVNTLEEYCETKKKYCKNGEDIIEIFFRWNELLFSFEKNGVYEVSKLTQIYDYMKYDLKHNYTIFKNFRSMYKSIKTISDFVASAEYGITNEEKFDIAKIIVKNLLLQLMKKLKTIRQKKSEDKTFIFFASKSILLSLRNVILGMRLASNIIVFENFDKAEFDYLSHTIIRLYEDTSRSKDDPMRFYVNIMFSPGVWGDPFVRIDESKYEKVRWEILNPLLDKMAFEDFSKKIFEGME